MTNSFELLRWGPLKHTCSEIHRNGKSEEGETSVDIFACWYEYTITSMFILIEPVQILRCSQLCFFLKSTQEPLATSSLKDEILYYESTRRSGWRCSVRAVGDTGEAGK